jgi:hypothetical protein
MMQILQLRSPNLAITIITAKISVRGMQRPIKCEKGVSYKISSHSTDFVLVGIRRSLFEIQPLLKPRFLQ